MDVNAILTEMEDFGFQGTDTSRLLSFVNQAYQAVCATPYPWLIKTQSFTQSAGVQNVTLTDSSGTVKAIYDFVDTTNQIPLLPERNEVLRKTYNDLTTTGTPQFYYFVGSTVKLYPVPNADTNYTIDYNVRPSDLNTTTNTAGLIPDGYMYLLIPRALATANEMNDDVDIAAYFENKFQRQLAEAQEGLWMRQYDRPERIADVMSDPSWLEWL